MKNNITINCPCCSETIVVSIETLLKISNHSSDSVDIKDSNEILSKLNIELG